MTDAEKIKLIRSALQKSQRELARDLGVTQPTLSNIEHGKMNASLVVLRKLHEKYKLNLDWFHNERGEMFREPVNNFSMLKGSNKDEIIRLLKEQNFLQKKLIESLEKQIFLLKTTHGNNN